MVKLKKSEGLFGTMYFKVTENYDQFQKGDILVVLSQSLKFHTFNHGELVVVSNNRAYYLERYEQGDNLVGKPSYLQRCLA